MTDDEKNGGRYYALALVYGYNELATKGRNLGEKVYFRLARGHAEEEARKLGVEIKHDDVGNVVLELPQRPPFIVFHERDIELMRAAVADFDAKRATPSPTGKPASPGGEVGACCGDCLGSGSIPVPPAGVGWADCPACGGTGAAGKPAKEAP